MERRRFTRPRLRINVRACCHQQTVGHVLNISDQGVCLSGRGVAPEQTLPLCLTLPLAINRKRELRVLAEPRWHDYLPNGHWRCGFYLHMENEVAALLATLAGRYGD